MIEQEIARELKAKPGCERCHGRGYWGTERTGNIVSPIICKCLMAKIGKLCKEDTLLMGGEILSEWLRVNYRPNERRK